MTERGSHSIAMMHHMRWLAALLVAVSHVRQNLLLDYAALRHPDVADKFIYWLGDYGQEGVMVFFVLSGFLVGGKAITLFQSKTIAADWPHFFVDRFSRIFVVLLPALLLSLVILIVVHSIAARAPFMVSGPWAWALDRPLAGDFSLGRWLSALVLMNGLTGPTLTVNAPLWSLAFEWFYYMAALAAVLALRRVFSVPAVAVMIYAAVLFLLAAVVHPAMLTLGVVWLSGVAAKIAFDRRILVHPITQWIGLGVVGGLILQRAMPVNALILGAAIAFMIAHRGWANWRGGERWGARLASFSYSLYLVHYPIIVLVLGLLYRFDHMQRRLPLNAANICIALGTLLAAVGFARVFAYISEDRTRFYRNLMLHPPRRPPVDSEIKALQQA